MNSLQIEKNVDTISSLLRDYSGKLRELTNEREKIRQRFVGRMYRTAMAIILYFAFYIGVLEFPIFESDSNIMTLVAMAVILTVGGLGLSFPNDLRKSKVSRLEIEIAADQLTKVVRYGSQILEHQERNLEKIVQLELEISLSDAEGALRHSSRYISKSPYVGTKKKYACLKIENYGSLVGIITRLDIVLLFIR